MHRFALLTLLPFGAAALLASCRAEPAAEQAARTSAMRCPGARWQQVVSRDSSLGFCLPPDYRRVKETNLWTRVAGEDGPMPTFVGREWVSIVRVSEAQTHVEGPWPPSFRRDFTRPCADCLEVTDYAVDWDSVGSRVVRVETARVTGGFSGERDAPAIQAAWRTEEGDWVLVQGRASTIADLDQLRRVLRTIRVRRPGRAAT